MTKFAREYHKLYDKQQWRKMRKHHLENNPLCAYCLKLGITELATVVDHIVPHKGDEALMFEPSNLQSLCKRCHDSVKAVEESRGVVLGNGLDGAPVDENHHWNRS